MNRPAGEPEVRVFFNPGCSKCRALRTLLEERGVAAEWYRYLEENPSADEITAVLERLGEKDPRAMMRTGEPLYREMGLDGAGREELIAAMCRHPLLIQRPILIRGSRAVVARPPERALEIL